jgi:tight adherence protein B
MGSTAIIIFITAAVGAAGYAIAQILGEITDPERRRLKQRLSSEGRTGGGASDQPAVSLYLAEQPKNPLQRIKILASLDASLHQAYPEASFARFLLLCLGLAGVGYVVIWAITGAAVLGVLVGCVLGVAPAIFLNMKRASRQKTMVEQLPEALDFLSRVLRAGHSLSTGLQMVGTELPEPLATEFRAAYDQHSVGVSMEIALRDMTKRVESTDFAFFVTATLIQRQTGGDLVQVLGNISQMVRQRLRLQQQVKAKTAEGRFTGYILSAFPAVMFALSYVLNPAYASQLLHSSTGLILAGVAFGLELLGLISIKMLTTVRV